MHFQRPIASACGHDTKAPLWQQALPAELQAVAIAPISFTVHHEYEMPAFRTLGYDEEGMTCYYCHSFVLGEPRSDDDEEFYEALVHGEEVQAWRLRDERWLVWKIVQKEGDCRGNQGCYSIAQSMPR